MPIGLRWKSRILNAAAIWSVAVATQGLVQVLELVVERRAVGVLVEAGLALELVLVGELDPGLAEKRLELGDIEPVGACLRSRRRRGGRLGSRRARGIADGLVDLVVQGGDVGRGDRAGRLLELREEIADGLLGTTAIPRPETLNGANFCFSWKTTVLSSGAVTEATLSWIAVQASGM